MKLDDLIGLNALGLVGLLGVTADGTGNFSWRDDEKSSARWTL